jgi:hypothetical protein
MMRWFLFVLAVLAACSSPSRSFEEILPATAGDWRRTDVTTLEPSSAPDLVRQLGLKRAASATYTGPSNVNLRVYEMNVATSAFELIQKWRQQDGRAVYNGPFFVIADPAAGSEASALLEAVRKQLK